MGMSTNGILTFGIDLGDTAYKHFNFLDEIWGDLESDLISNFQDKYQKLPFELVLYCMYDYPMYILSVPNTTKCVHRGYVEYVNLTEPSEESISEFINFCKEINLDLPHEPKWMITSLYG